MSKRLLRLVRVAFPKQPMILSASNFFNFESLAGCTVLHQFECRCVLARCA